MGCEKPRLTGPGFRTIDANGTRDGKGSYVAGGGHANAIVDVGTSLSTKGKDKGFMVNTISGIREYILWGRAESKYFP